MSDQEIVDFNKNVNESFDLLAPDDIIGKDSNSKKSDTNQNVIAAKRNKKKKISALIMGRKFATSY